MTNDLASAALSPGPAPARSVRRSRRWTAVPRRAVRQRRLGNLYWLMWLPGIRTGLCQNLRLVRGPTSFLVRISCALLSWFKLGRNGAHGQVWKWRMRPDFVLVTDGRAGKACEKKRKAEKPFGKVNDGHTNARRYAGKKRIVRPPLAKLAWLTVMVV